MDYDGDASKKPPACTDVTKCENMRDAGGGFEGERYRCEICGARYYLDYEDMK